ncbi:glycosyltransferase family 2 protein [Geotalea uraniireducens]|uniref:Glycosyl transferase, family 2 n=1 Tax=Geotalea uraniireducens (strain Rf4) TaxID=351605 RepID=A5G826_GEOUR|nr:glycosyltransferase family 2 protein [Geotalea uraniireducens]ABQ27944.1 glycosyl transferase, family 2 [Geotalea uraniireducens Rf4]
MSKTIVVIPAYNEGGVIARVIENVRRVVPDFDILVVNDGSKDSTAREAAAAGAIVVSHSFNMGYGVTIQTAYKFAYAKGYDFLVQIDGDGQHDPAFIPELMRPVVAGDTDFVVGSRFLGVESYRPSFSRRLGILFFRKLVSSLIGRTISDPTSGYQAFNRDVMRFFTTDVFPCDYPDADMLITLNLAGFRIREIPVRMFANAAGKTMHSGFKPLYYMFKMCLSIVVTLLRNRQLYRR